MTSHSLPLFQASVSSALHHAQTGDIWLFRGNSNADKAIRALTNAPVNHVGMIIALEDLPPLMWHAELGKSLQDYWTGTHHRGVQLHLAEEAITTWQNRYQQKAYIRQYHGSIAKSQEDELLKLIALRNGTPFPSTLRLSARWLKGRARVQSRAEVSYCAEVVAEAYQAMGLLKPRATNQFDPGKFWSGDNLDLQYGQLGSEVRVF